jgi:flavin reductase (DIM6/NTAB) family NADH-FMN oxidoreductase RutF
MRPQTDAAYMLRNEHSGNVISELLTPRLTVMVTTVDDGGGVNAAPYSFFSAVAYDPPMVQLSIAEQKHSVTEKDLVHNEQLGDIDEVIERPEYRAEDQTTRKDALQDIIERGEFGLSVLSAEYVEEVVGAAIRWPGDVNELEEVGLGMYESTEIEPPLVQEAYVGAECTAVDIAELSSADGESAGFFTVLGEVLQYHVDPDILDDGEVSPDRLDPLLEFSGGVFLRCSGTVSAPQYTYPGLSSREQ